MNKLVDRISALLCEVDPIKFRSPSKDAYDHEAKLIYVGLKPNMELEDVHDLIYKVFCQLNYVEDNEGNSKFMLDIAGPKKNYFELAALIFAENNNANK